MRKNAFVVHCVYVESVMINKAFSSNLYQNTELIDFPVKEEKQQGLTVAAAGASLFIHYFPTEKVVACSTSEQEVLSTRGFEHHAIFLNQRKKFFRSIKSCFITDELN